MYSICTISARTAARGPATKPGMLTSEPFPPRPSCSRVGGPDGDGRTSTRVCEIGLHLASRVVRRGGCRRDVVHANPPGKIAKSDAGRQSQCTQRPPPHEESNTQASLRMKVVAACVAAAAALDCASAFVAPVVSSGFASSSLSRSSRARAPGLRMTSAVDTEAKVRVEKQRQLRRWEGARGLREQRKRCGVWWKAGMFARERERERQPLCNDVCVSQGEVAVAVAAPAAGRQAGSSKLPLLFNIRSFPVSVTPRTAFPSSFA